MREVWNPGYTESFIVEKLKTNTAVQNFLRESFDPFTPKSDYFQISPEGSPEI